MGSRPISADELAQRVEIASEAIHPVLTLELTQDAEGHAIFIDHHQPKVTLNKKTRPSMIDVVMAYLAGSRD